MFVRIAPFIFVCLWATGFVGARLGMPYSEPGTFLTIRFFWAFLLVAAIAMIARAPWPGLKTALQSVGIGMLIHGIYLGCVFWAIDQGMPAGVSAVVVGLQPLLTAILAGYVLKEKITLQHWLGLPVGMLGVVLVLLPKLNITASGVSAETIIASILGMVSVTIGTVWQKSVGGASDLRSGTACQYLGAIIPVGLLAFFVETNEIEWAPGMIIAMAWSIFVLSIVAIFLLMWLIREGSVARVSSLFFMVPAVAAIMAYFLFGETLGAVQIAGMVLCAIAVALATHTPASTPGQGPIATRERASS